MPRHHVLAAVRHVITPSVFFLVLAALITVTFVSFAPDLVPPKGGAEVGKLKDSQKEALAISIEINKLVITLGTLIFGVVGALVVGKDDVKHLTGTQLTLAMTALLAACSALYFSYVVYAKMVEMLGNNFLEVLDNSIVWPRLLQINSLGIAMVMLAALFLTTVRSAPTTPNLSSTSSTGGPHVLASRVTDGLRDGTAVAAGSTDVDAE